MNFLADEGVDFPVVQRLRSNGHEVLYVAEMAPGVVEKGENLIEIQAGDLQ